MATIKKRGKTYTIECSGLRIKRGNTKIDDSCGIFNIPTAICPTQCPGCYAKRSEKIFPKCLEAREHNLKAYKWSPAFFEVDMVSLIEKANVKTFRIHESGDFFEQRYIDAWVEVIKSLPNVKFYTYTKTLGMFDFSALLACENFNLVDSITPYGVNFGSLEYCQKLVNEGWFLCPCGIDDTQVCMKDCTACTTMKKVCFKKH